MADELLHDLLVCPLHRTPLVRRGDALGCAHGCDYPVIDGIPFLLARDSRPTHASIAANSFALAERMLKGGAAAEGNQPGAVDTIVQELVAATNSILYVPLIGRLNQYPIPQFSMRPERPGALLLDIGCGWGRWCVAAARAGFTSIGIDPSLESVLAARRVAQELGARAHFVVADSRYLPFAKGSFDAAYSYSVLQHFSKEDVRATLQSLAEVLKPGGATKLHLLNRYGLRSVQVQMSRGFRGATGFETRYWSPREMLECFSTLLGPSSLEIDGFFVQARYEDRHLFRLHHRLIVEASHALRAAARVIPMLKTVADNLFVTSRVARRSLAETEAVASRPR